MTLRQVHLNCGAQSGISRRDAAAALLGILALLLGCKESSSERPSETVVAQDQLILKDGHQSSYPLVAGTYRLEMTATGDGAGIEWIGAACTNAKETKAYDSNCALTRSGQLVITNPTTFGLGKTTSVTVRLVRTP
ncbi:MAG: hypothetical protein HYZ29_06080 [Myxococcales bacterium]|nr:hypothetical protein [Myxococcales bacterium]